MGRPTDYCQDILDSAEEYVKNFEKYGDAIPSIEGLADHLGKARSTLYKWATEEGKEPFSDILESLLAKQGRTLINKGLTGEFNSTVTKLIMTKHDYSDKQTNEHSGPNGSPIEIDQKWEVEFLNPGDV